MTVVVKDKGNNGRGKGRKTYRADGDALRYYRDRAHLTLYELDDKSGVSYTQISRIENGESESPRWKTIRLLADALSVEMDDLLIYSARRELNDFEADRRNRVNSEGNDGNQPPGDRDT